MCPTAISAFEHDTLRVGSQNAEAGGAALTQVQFDALARFNDANGQRYFRLGHRCLTLGSFVGYLQVGKLGIEILPKADRETSTAQERGSWQRFLLEMLRVSLGLPLYSPTDAARRVGRSTLLELVALRFVAEVEGLLHEGLAKSYRDVEANGATFRGRLVGAAHVRENAARADRFYVRYSAFEHDVPINRVLAAALHVLGRHPLAPAVRARVAAAAFAFPEVTISGVRATACDRLVLTRSTVRYRDALTLAQLILEHQAPELCDGAHQVFAVLFDMNALWERYVGWLFRRAAEDRHDVVLQEPRGFWQVGPASPRKVRPDLVVRERGTGRVLLIADAKWKTLGERPPADDDLKQMFVYNHLFDSPRSVLVYPTTHPVRRRLEGKFLDRAHGCMAMEIGLFEGSTLRADAMIEQVKGLC